MLKKFIYLTCITLMLSCGASKKTTQKTSEKTKTLKEVAVPPIINEEPEVRETEPELALDKEPEKNDVETITEAIVNTKPLDKNLFYSELDPSVSPSVIDKVIWTAVSYKGTPYKYGGTSKEGMDCSGLLYKAFQSRGINIPRRAIWMYDKGYTIPLSEAKRGDLLFFNIPDKKSKDLVNHVAIVSSNENRNVKFIHSINSRGVVVSSILEDYWRKVFVEAKRVVE